MSQKKGVYLVLATAIISGFAIFINKFSVAKIDPSVFTFLKNIVVAMFLLSILLLTKEFNMLKQLKKKDWMKLVLIGLVGGSIPFLLFFEGLALTSAVSGALIHKTLFIYASLLAVFLLKEKVSKPIFLSAVLLLLGNFLLLKITSFSIGVGELLVLGATLLWACENVLSKHVLKDLSGNVVAFGRMFFGSLFILVYLGFTGKLTTLVSLSGAQILWTLLTSVLLLLFVTTYYNGLKYVKVSVATSILLLGSPVTLLLSYFFAGGTMSLVQFAGLLSIVAGVIAMIFLVEFAEKYEPTPSESHIRSE